MKKFLPLLFPALLLCSIAQAQTSPKKGGWGLKIGLNGSNIRAEDGGSSDWKTGLVTGVFFTFAVNDQFSVQPELLYSSMGGKELMSEAETGLRLNYFSIPVLAQYKLAKKVSVFAGPQIDVMIQAKSRNIAGFEKVTDNFKEYSINATGGVAVWPVHCFGLYARYIYGLNNISLGTGDLKNQGVQLTAALKL